MDDYKVKQQNQESQQIEWKWSWQDEFLKWLCGYANTEGGILYIGVNDDGYVVGIDDSKRLLESLPNKINDKLGIIASINIYKANGAENVRYGNHIPKSISGKLINQYACGKINSETIETTDKCYNSLMAIEKENSIWEAEDGTREYMSIEIIKYPFAISCDGKYYKRSGSTLHELNGFELQNFLLERAGRTWDAVPIPEVGVSDLSKDALEAFRKKAVKSNRMTESEVNVSDELLLRNLKLFDGEYLTRAAILLFHSTPERYVTGSYIKIGYFSLVGAFGDNAEPIEDLQYQDVVDGPLLLQADKAIELIFTKYFKALVDYEGIQRTETYMLTRAVIRELLLNAVNHKDYATGVPIQVSVYEDRIVIFNMGSWSKRVPTDEHIYEKHESVPHNPKIADVAFRSGDVESWGRGFLKIKAECKKVNAPLPLIDAENGGVSISASGCEKYMSILRYGQYGQVGADGIWRSKEDVDEKSGDKKTAIKSGDKKTTKKTQMQYDKILAFMEEGKEYGIWDFCELLDLKESRTKKILQGLSGYIEIVGSNRDRRYKKKRR
ncbi:MAG: putative DNA binding domain-containing protein [Bacteroidales bacterium]|nr:putative DNA binding domain-containing protein [Lachnoclostridium sp.]MCM1383537.1 putative DNA binding domain-containing protein [Lachnoclostridium sp.]MCM1464180.1 putative DNA binding domain-containing protein [Bacteroidales bacterium]